MILNVMDGVTVALKISPFGSRLRSIEFDQEYK